MQSSTSACTIVIIITFSVNNIDWSHRCSKQNCRIQSNCKLQTILTANTNNIAGLHVK